MIKYYYISYIVSFLEEVKNQVLYLAVPKNLRKIYNFGFILGICLIIQIIRGLVLSIMYIRGADSRFSGLFLIIEYRGTGNLIRYIHINVVSFFFIFIYIHIGRGLYYRRFLNKKVWLRGVTILLLLIATAFIGYVLPNNQMSYWGASVITSLLREVPYLGKDLVELIWGRVRVCKLTLLRFFRLHFILPFIILVFVVLHIIFLHDQGSSNPGGTKSTKKAFNQFQSIVDFFFFFLITMGIIIVVGRDEDLFGDDENFVKCNVVETPVHIQPEWYFLFAYAILRSITNKLGGVVGLVSSIFILYFLALNAFRNFNRFSHKPVSKMAYWRFIFNFFFLSWIGICRVEYPFVEMTQLFRVLYFSYFFVYLIFSIVNLYFESIKRN